RQANPKSESRNPKQIRNSKSEIQNAHEASRDVHGPFQGHGAPHGRDFRVRISGLGFVSDSRFGFRDSDLTIAGASRRPLNVYSWQGRRNREIRWRGALVATGTSDKGPHFFKARNPKYELRNTKSAIRNPKQTRNSKHQNGPSDFESVSD